jgi:hypothetical protein
LSIGSLVFLNWPKQEIFLKKGEKVHILPFKNSTVFLVVKTQTKVKVINKVDGYKEILFQNKVGWVKDDR